MTSHLIVITVVRLVALWLALSCIEHLSAIPFAMSIASTPPSDVPPVASVVILATIYAALAIALWFFPAALVKGILPPATPPLAVSFSAHDLARVGAALLGMWMIGKGVPMFLWLVVSHTLSAGAPLPNMGDLPVSALTDWVTAPSSIAIGVLFVLKANAFARRVAPVSSSS